MFFLFIYLKKKKRKEKELLVKYSCIDRKAGARRHRIVGNSNSNENNIGKSVMLWEWVTEWSSVACSERSESDIEERAKMKNWKSSIVYERHEGLGQFSVFSDNQSAKLGRLSESLLHLDVDRFTFFLFLRTFNYKFTD